MSSNTSAQQGATETTETAIPMKPCMRVAEHTDVGNAQMFAAMHQDTVYYVRKTDSFICWNGMKFVDDQVLLYGKLQAVCEKRFEEAKMATSYEIVTTNDICISQAEAIKWAKKTSSLCRMDAILKIAKRMQNIVVDHEKLDADPFLMGCSNGVLDLRTLSLVPPSPHSLMTRNVKAAYNPDAKCPRWMQFLDEITMQNHDLADYLQEVAGYTLSGSACEHKMWVLHGKGANGKSTFLEVFLDILGDYGISTPSHTFVKSESRAMRNDVARFDGPRAVGASEINIGKKLDEALMKRIVSSDKVTARFIGKEYFDFNPKVKIFMAVNVYPEVCGAEDGVYRRMMIVPFEAVFAGKNINKNLIEELRAERDGILRWATEGFVRWYKRGTLVEPECVLAANKDFRDQMDVVGSFLAEETVRAKGTRTPVCVLYDAFAAWATASGIDAPSKKLFGVLLRQQGFRQKKIGSTRYWLGINVQSPSVTVSLDSLSTTEAEPTAAPLIN